MQSKGQQPQPLWDSIAALTGSMSAVALTLSIVDIGPPPILRVADGASSQMQRLDAYVLSVGWVLFIWFAATLRQRLKASEGSGGRLSEIAFAGAIALAVMGIASAAFRSAAVGWSDPSQLEALADTWIGLASLPAAVMLTATALASIRFNALPAGLGLGAGAIGLYVLVVGGLVSTSTAGVTAGGSLSMIGAWAFIVWMTATSITLTLSARASASPRR